MMKKKGSLELSVNGIVVLILAIIMLGLGIGFVTNMFGNVQDKFDTQISQEPEPNSASYETPMSLSKDLLVMRSGNTAALKASIYNPEEVDIKLTLGFGCTEGTISKIFVTPTNVLSQQSKTFQIKITPKKVTKETEDLCQFVSYAPDGLAQCNRLSTTTPSSCTGATGSLNNWCQGDSTATATAAKPCNILATLPKKCTDLPNTGTQLECESIGCYWDAVSEKCAGLLIPGSETDVSIQLKP